MQPGVTAIVYINGHEVSQINSGIYNFVEDSAIKAEMDKRVSVTGVRGLIVKTWQGLVRFISGTKVNEPEKINDSKRSVSEIIGMLNADSVVSVYLKRNAGFPALFGYATAPDGKQSFVPMRIKTKILDAEVGIHMFLKVGDFHKFIEKFMLERNSVNFIDIQNELSVYVKNILQDELKDENFDAYGISQCAIDRINGKLAEIPVYEECGIVFVRVAEVTCNSEELDRFRKLSQELWCSENELDYLHRVNEFKNRLARENNAKAIDDARSEVELKDELRNINRDRLLSEDEFEAFTTALALRKFNRANDAEIEQLRKHIINHYVQRVRQVKHPDLQVVSPFNCIFKGRPGTGKTTVARIVAGILKEEGIIEKGCCVEMDASSITSGWVGFSAKFAKLAALQSLGGVLFIDEAYSLMNTKGTKGNSGAEVIDTLTPLMENYRDRLIVIFAGYENEMNTLLENTNPGFASRFKTEVLFQDYNASQMFSIFMSIAANNYYKITSSAQGRLAALLEYIEQNKDSNKRFANARTVRSLFETIRAKASDRMANDSKADYDVIKMEDVAIPIEELKAIGAI